MGFLKPKHDDEGNFPEPTIDNKLELLRHLTTIHSGIKKEITEDLVLAKLNDKDRKYVVEATVNAYYGHKLFQVIKETASRWTWNAKAQKWEKMYLSKQQKKIIDLHADNLFNAFMKRVFMILGTNRNVPKNYLVRLMAGFEEDDPTEQEAEIDNLKKRVKDQLTPTEE